MSHSRSSSEAPATPGPAATSLVAGVPEPWFGVLGAAVTLPVAVRRIWPIPVLAVVTTAVAALTALGRAELDMDIMLGMAIYTVAVTSRRPVAVAALAGTEAVLICGLIAAFRPGRSAPPTRRTAFRAGALWFVGDRARAPKRDDGTLGRPAITVAWDELRERTSPFRAWW